MIDPRTEYDRRLAFWSGEAARADRRHFVVSNLRLAVALPGAVVLWLAFIRATLSTAWVLLPAAAFLALLVVHARVLQQRDRAYQARRVYERGIDRLLNRWAGQGRDGARFLDDHPFARDLDLFGRASLFELLNTTRTEAGEGTLADWLRAGADPDEILARQQAIEELRPNVAFREDLAVLASEVHVSRTGELATWAASSPAGLSSSAAVVLAACSIVTVAVGVLVFAESIGFRWLVSWLLAQTVVAAIWRGRVQHTLAAVSMPERDLALVRELLQRVEREVFTSPKLTALRAALIVDDVVPSRAIGTLQRLMSWVDSTRNQLFGPIAAALVLRSQLAAAIDRWHATFGHAVGEWLRAIGELEALVALATYAYEHQSDPFPTIVEHGPVFDAEELGHPLIPDDVCVRNAVRLGGDAPQLMIISGSNMSGKSTALRATGVNVVLALAGAPVRARTLRVSPLAIGATLRIEDSLESGRSRFYAEILRIRAIVDLARGPMIFLLDEILHGTNSHDRRVGAEAIIRALVGRGAIGLVTTHDLALTEVVKSLGPAAVNMHFEDRVEEGVMIFDYRMRPGVVERSNALALMRAVGLDI